MQNGFEFYPNEYYSQYSSAFHNPAEVHRTFFPSQDPGWDILQLIHFGGELMTNCIIRKCNYCRPPSQKPQYFSQERYPLAKKTSWTAKKKQNRKKYFWNLCKLLQLWHLKCPIKRIFCNHEEVQFIFLLLDLTTPSKFQPCLFKVHNLKRLISFYY